MGPALADTPPPGGRGPGRPRDPEVDRQLVDATVDLVSEAGFEGLTMEAVAKRAGVAKATVYRRFPSKVDLVVAVCHAVSPTLPEPPDTGSVRDDLLAVLTSVTQKLQRSDTGRLMPAMVAASGHQPEVREALGRFSASRRSTTTAVLERAIERGELRADADVELLTDALVGPLIYRHLVTGRSTGPAVLRRHIDQVVRGVAAS